MKSTSFEASLAEGRLWEERLAKWLLLYEWGTSVANVHDFGGLGNDKAPKLLTPRGRLVLPDLEVFDNGRPKMWVECKKKEKADWHWKTQTYVTGIDRKHYAQYRRVKRETGLPLYLLFLHELEREIRGEELSWLEANVHHFDYGKKMHPSGMVFWEYAALQLYGSLDELLLVDEWEMPHGAA